MEAHEQEQQPTREELLKTVEEQRAKIEEFEIELKRKIARWCSIVAVRNIKIGILNKRIKELEEANKERLEQCAIFVEQLNKQKKEPKKRTPRQKKELKDYVYFELPQKFVEAVKFVIGKKKGRKAVAVLYAAIKSKLMERPSYETFANTFGKLCCNSEYYNVMNCPNFLTDKEIMEIRDVILKTYSRITRDTE